MPPARRAPDVRPMLDGRDASASSLRRLAIVSIKAVHSMIFLANSAAILHLCWAGLLNRPSKVTRVAFVLASIESSVFVLNRGRCPLTQVVERLGSEDGRVSDIFLPRWFADRIPWLCTPPLVLGVVALLAHRYRDQAGDEVPTTL